MQYHYKFIIFHVFCFIYFGDVDAKRHQRQQLRNSKSELAKVIENDKIRKSEPNKSNIQPDQVIFNQTNTDSSLYIETHQLKKVIPQDIYSTDVTATKSRSIQIRVLLADTPSPAHWSILSESGFWLLDPRNQKRRISVDAASMTLLCHTGSIFINNRRLTRDEVVVKAKEGNIIFDGRTYQGSLYIVSHGEKTLLINCIDLEDYVACVLYSEAWPGWPQEMNKVLAIAIRSYGVAMMRQAADSKRIYHVKNNVAHQVYAGVHGNKLLHDAVLQTNGIIMTYKNKPIIAMYDACCGGIVTARMKSINFTQAPYLARKMPCTSCKTCKIFSWTAEFDKGELTTLLKRHIPKLSKIKSLYVSKKDPAGLVQQVSIKSGQGFVSISGKKMYGLPKIKSFCYTIENTPSKIIFKGRGYGHHVGLCQWGACQMVRDGTDYKRTLHFYYPGVTFMKIVR